MEINKQQLEKFFDVIVKDIKSRPTMAMTEDFMTVREATKALGMPEHAIRRAINGGELDVRFRTVGKSKTMIIRKRDLDDWYERQRGGLCRECNGSGHAYDNTQCRNCS